jgi:hypothetical protein
VLVSGVLLGSEIKSLNAESAEDAAEDAEETYRPI